jgi:metal-sulfur cluster biosynthetic enzyme
MASPTNDQVWAALDTVLDPCSVFNGTRLSMVELGMVESVTIEEGEVHILLFLDDPTCLLFFEINRMIEEAVGAIEGVTKVSVDLKADDIWTEDRMTEDGRARLHAVRERRREAHERHGTRAPGWPLPNAGISGQPLPMMTTKEA